MNASITNESSLRDDELLDETFHDTWQLVFNQPSSQTLQLFFDDLLVGVSNNESVENSASPFLVLPKRMLVSLHNQIFILGRSS